MLFLNIVICDYDRMHCWFCQPEQRQRLEIEKPFKISTLWRNLPMIIGFSRSRFLDFARNLKNCGHCRSSTSLGMTKSTPFKMTIFDETRNDNNRSPL